MKQSSTSWHFPCSDWHSAHSVRFDGQCFGGERKRTLPLSEVRTARLGPNLLLSWPGGGVGRKR